MRLTNQEVVELYEGLDRMRTAGLSSLPVLTKYALVLDMKKLQPSYAAIIDTRNDVITSNSSPNELGELIVLDERLSSVNKLLDDLRFVENDIDLVIIPLSGFADSSCSIDDLYSIFPIINGEA